MKRLNTKDIENIVDAYQKHDKMTDIGIQYDLTRQRIWQILQVAGIDTSKKRGGTPTICDSCGKEFKKPKCQIRKRLHCFCSNECYYEWLAKRSTGHKPWRHGMRIARAIVFKKFNLKKEHIVHHEDGNNKNNDVKNLKVFKNQGDHLRHHRGFDVTPLWEGCNI